MVEPLSDVESSSDSAAGVLLLIIDNMLLIAGRVSQKAGRHCLAEAFSWLRRESNSADCRDVLLGLAAPKKCMEFVDVLSSACVGSCGERGPGLLPGSTSGLCLGHPSSSFRVEPAMQEIPAPLQVLTWNMAHDAISKAAPPEFSVADKGAAIDAELLRWGADVVALQERVAPGISARLSEHYVEVSYARSHSGYTSLLVSRRLSAVALDALAPFLRRPSQGAGALCRCLGRPLGASQRVSERAAAAMDSYSR